MKDGTFVDFGGQWVGSTQERFYALIKEMGGETYPSPGGGLTTLQRGIINTDEYHRIKDDTDANFPGGDIYAKAKKAVNDLALTVDVQEPWKHPDAMRLDGLTFGEWLRQNVENESVRKLVATEVGSVPSASAEEISMLHLGWLIHACDSIDALFGPAQADRVIGGTQTVARKVAEKLGIAIRLGQPVRRDRMERQGRDRAFRRAQRRGAPRHRGDPAEPRGRDRIAPVAAGEPRADHVALAAGPRHQGGDRSTSAPFWRDDGLAGTSYDHVSIIGETADSRNPESVSKAGVLTGFVYADNARKVSLMAPAERKKAVPRRACQALRPEGARAGALPRVQLVDRSVDQAAASPASSRPARPRCSAPRCARRSGRSAGPEPRPRPSGRPSSTARSATGEREADGDQKDAWLAVGCAVRLLSPRPTDADEFSASVAESGLTGECGSDITSWPLRCCSAWAPRMPSRAS